MIIHQGRGGPYAEQKAPPQAVMLGAPGHCQLNAKNLHMGAITRKRSLVFFFRDRPYFRYLSPVIFLHKEGIRERLLIKLTMPAGACRRACAASRATRA